MMDLSNTVLTLATADELQELALLSIIGEITDDIFSFTDSDAMYNVVLAIEEQEMWIEIDCAKRANRIVELCLTGK